MRSPPLLALFAAALTLGTLQARGVAQDAVPIVAQRDDESAATAVQRAVIAQLRTTLGPAHIDVRVAQARRTALDEALRGLERDGRFFSELPPV